MKNYIPSWGSLKEFLLNSGVTKSDVKNILRRKGVFLASDEKDLAFPWLALGGITSGDINYLVNKVSAKSEKVKHGNFALSANDGVSQDEVVECISGVDLNQHGYTDGLHKVVFLEKPRFTFNAAEQKCVIRYKVEKTEYSNIFTAYHNQYYGKLEYSFDSDNKIKCILERTCEETNTINKRIQRVVETGLKLANIVDEKEHVKSIHFGLFTNKQRFSFFRKLADGDPAYHIKPCAILHLGVAPDASKTCPDELDALLDEVRKLNLSGKHLETGRLWVEDVYHDYLQIYRVIIQYDFGNKNNTGKLTASFSFPDYSKSDVTSSEFHSVVESAKSTSGRKIDDMEINHSFKMMVSSIENEVIKKIFSQ